MDGTRGTVLLDGNRAAALGAIMAGCTVLAWYPITPSSSLCEAVIEYAERFRTDRATGERRFAAIQAEDELAAMGIVLGASWAGARAMTGTSGPGISLMAELTGLGYYAEIPAVVFDIQRVGPSTGLPTRTMQGDLGFVHTLSHGDTRHPVLLPGTVIEAYEDAQHAFDLAERLQTPVFVLSDLDLGMNQWMTPPLPYPEIGIDRGKVLDAAALDRLTDWARYRDVDGDGVAYRTLPGTPNPRAGFFTRGSGHDENALYTESPDAYQRNMERLRRKVDGARTMLPAPLIDEAESAAAILAYGTSHHAVVEARERLAEQGLSVDYLRIRGLPLHPWVGEFISRHDRVYLVEQNRDGQLESLLRAELPGELCDRVRGIRHFNGVPIDAEVITQPVLAGERAGTAAAGRRVSVADVESARSEDPLMALAADKVNRLGLSREDYKGAHTTLCAGCGHNSITNHIVKALYDSAVEPHLLAKMSGIGCSSKAAAYFVERAHGLQRSPRPDALAGHRRQAGQPGSGGLRGERRWRHRFDRARPVLSHDHGATSTSPTSSRTTECTASPRGSSPPPPSSAPPSRRADQTSTSRSTSARLPSTWGPASWPEASAATASSWCLCFRRRWPTGAPRCWTWSAPA